MTIDYTPVPELLDNTGITFPPGAQPHPHRSISDISYSSSDPESPYTPNKEFAQLPLPGASVRRRVKASSWAGNAFKFSPGPPAYNEDEEEGFFANAPKNPVLKDKDVAYPPMWEHKLGILLPLAGMLIIVLSMWS